jgi:hypothetical protein
MIRWFERNEIGVGHGWHQWRPIALQSIARADHRPSSRRRCLPGCGRSRQGPPPAPPTVAEADRKVAAAVIPPRREPLSHTAVMVASFSNRMEVIMSYESRLLAGILLIVLPTVMIGGVSILSLLIGDPAYMENPLRQDLWRAGHAHAGVWLILALVALRYVDEANLSNVMKWLVRSSIPIAAILVPAAFFLSVLSPDATAPNGLIYLAYVGAVLLAVGVLVLGVGLVRRPARRS